MGAISVLHAAGGTARFADLLSAGVSESELRRLVACDRVGRPYRGVYALPGATRDRVLATYFAGTLTCVTAAAALGLRQLSTARRCHLEVPSDRGGHADASAPHRQVVLHRVRDAVMAPAEVDVSRAIDIAAACVSPLEQLVMLDHGLAAGLLRTRDIRNFTKTPTRRRLWLERHADPACESVPETSARVALVASGLHVESQAPLGQYQRADFLVEGRVYVEIDGYASHSGRTPFGHDRARDRRLLARDRPVMRFTYDDAVRRPAELVRDVRAVLAGR